MYALVLGLSASLSHALQEQFDSIYSVDMYEYVTTKSGSKRKVLIHNSGTSNVFMALAKSQGVKKVNKKGILMMTRQFIALGKELYALIQAGEPVVNVISEPVQVLPFNESAQVIPAINLSGWKAPVVKKYRIETKNYLGMTPVVFEFMLLFSYGGSQDGHGSYITGAEIKPTLVDVQWGFEFNANFKLQTILNEGSATNPIAGAVLMLDTEVKTPIQQRQLNKTFYINGLGDLSAY